MDGGGWRKFLRTERTVNVNVAPHEYDFCSARAIYVAHLVYGGGISIGVKGRSYVCGVVDVGGVIQIES